MNLPNEDNKSEERRHLEFLEWIMRYQDGALTPAEVQMLSEMVRHDPARRKLFRQVQMRTATLHDLLRMDAFGRDNRLLDMESEEAGAPNVDDSRTGSALFRTTSQRGRQHHRVWPSRTIRWVGGLTLALLFLCGFFVWNRPGGAPEVAQSDSRSVRKQPVLLVEENRAMFVGPVVLTAGSVVEPQQDYMLQSGLVKLKFPCGATAILEGPSIFRVATVERLILNTGGCSVHAPPGAEGFEVLTPQTKVIDRGTRFYVKVQDNSETEVHVIEGAADLYSLSRPDDSAEASQREDHLNTESNSVRLGNGEAVRLGGFVNALGERTPFDPGMYRGQLPDRLVGYEASSTVDGMADELTSLTVQRQGQIYSYSVEDLIPIEVTSFRGDPRPEPNGYLCGFRNKPNRPEELLEDRKLVTGLINFGGQPLPLKRLPVNNSDAGDDLHGLPGLGIRFRTPVVNHPGPDVVLFEIQSFVTLSEGDPFHVYPVSERPGLSPLTVTKFDLTINSPGVRKVAPLWSHRFRQPVASLDELRELDAPIKVDVGHMHFHVIGVGIDLSDLGYADGERVEELFFQHASHQDGPKVDPVFIAGLPALSPEKE